MPFKEPFILGPFSGRRRRASIAGPRGRVPPGFSVRWRGRVVHARLDQSVDHDGRLHIRSSLGRIPSTASDPATRVACFMMLRHFPGALPPAWSARLLPDHQPQLEVETIVELWPITVTNLVVELTLFLISLSPYLDLMDQAGVTLVASAAAPVPGGLLNRKSIRSPLTGTREVR